MPSFLHTIRTIFGVLLDALTFIKLCIMPATAVAAENLFLRKQLGMFIERKTKPRRATDDIRFTLARLSCLFDWSNALTIVKPDTLSVGIAKDFVCFGNGNLVPAGDLAFPLISES